MALAGVAAAAALTFVQPQPDSIEQPLRPPAPVSAPELPASDSTAFPQTDLEPGRSAQPAATDALAPASPSPEPANGVRSSGLADDAPLADPPETGPPPLPSPLPEAAVAEASTSTEDGSDTPLADSTNTVSPSLASAPLALGATAAPVVAGRTSGTLLGAQTQASPEGASNVPATSASADEIASVPLGTTPPDASTAAVPASGPAPPPPMDDRAAIEQLLNQYRSAYEAKDVNRVLSVFPTLPNVSEVELAFSEASEVLIGFTPPDIRLTSTTTATASLKAHPEFRPKGRWKRYV